jgi:RNA polymerase sigma-70 factor (ECF subfamily)
VRGAADPAAEAARVFRESSGQAVATLIRLLGDFDLAEEAVADAFARAVERWPRDGLPDKPAAWILTTAKRRAIDIIRRRENLRAKTALLRPLTTHDGDPMDALLDEPVFDDQLRLIFTCCHPALSPEARVALTLRTLGGLSTAEIARAFLVPEGTLAQRLVRAKNKIKLAGIPYEVPDAHRLPERLPSVLAVLYLIFNEGYAPSSGPAVRFDLCAEAIRLGRVLVALMPDEPEAIALLALMLFHHARADARTTADGSVVLLEDQDQRRWDAEQIAEATALLARARRRRRIGVYLLQAEIAAVHARRVSAATTDWLAIAALYQALRTFTDSPIVALNHAVAVAMAGDLDAALAELDRLEAGGALAAYHRLPATRAELLARAGRHREAIAHYRRALALGPAPPDAAALRRRLALAEAAAVAGG